LKEDYDRVFVEVWENGKIVKIKRFRDAFEAWEWIVENDIKYYTVSKAICVIDNSGWAD